MMSHVITGNMLGRVNVLPNTHIEHGECLKNKLIHVSNSSCYYVLLVPLRHVSNNNCNEMSFIDDNTSLLHANGIELTVIPEE